ncbi:methyltransferase domain-containing protein [Clostridium disporicum]|uniref:methyltransferase domain-containing protein n=1 Tax=Clostridium disporicum TaxID=84024 RepID=UPI0034A585AC
MFLKINIKGDNADFASYIFAKNPNRHFVSNERVMMIDETIPDGLIDFSKIDLNTFSCEIISILKKDKLIDEDLKLINKNKNTKYFAKNGELIRKKTSGDLENHFIYKKYTSNEVEAILFSQVNSLNFSKDFHGYVNEKEYLVSSVFQSVIDSVLKTALNKEGDDYDNLYDLTYEIGPLKPKLSRENLCLLFTALGYEVEVENANEEISFKSNRQEIIFLKIKKHTTIRESLRHILILISAIDNFKHFVPSESDMLKFKKYADGWVENHPLSKMIIDRYLSYSTYSKELIKELENKDKESNDDSIQEELGERGYGENGLTLNQLRMEKMKEAVLKCNPNKVLDLGCGEGNLIGMLADESFQVTGMDSSEKAIRRAYKNLRKKKKISRDSNVKIIQGSLYYKDSRLKGFDTIVLCEVIEHIELERVKSVIDNIMFLEPENFILSTPNKDFNKFFKDLKGELRYYDHRFEFTYNEFFEFCDWICETYGFICNIEDFGKEIEGIKPTLMATFKKEQL